MSTQETEAENDANDNTVPNGSTPPTLTRANTEEAIEDPLSLYIRSSRIIEDNENISSATDALQNPIPKCSSLETVITVPDNDDDVPVSLPSCHKTKRSNQILPPAEPQKEPSIPVRYPPSFFQQGFYSNPESSNSFLGYGDPEVIIDSLDLLAHDTDLERYLVDAQASGDDTPLSVTSTLYAHDLVNPQDKGKGKADPLDNNTENGSPPPSLDEDDDQRDLERRYIAAWWKTGEIVQMQLGEAGPSRMPYTSQLEEGEEMSDVSQELDTSTRRIAWIGKSKRGDDDDEFVTSSDEEYSKSQDSDWSPSKSLSPPPVKCSRAPKRKFSDSSSDESEQPTKRKCSKKVVYPSPRRVQGPRGKRIEEDYEDSDESISRAAGTSKSSLGKRKRKSTRDEIPIVQRKGAWRIIESSEEDNYKSAAESNSPPVKTKKKKPKKTTQIKSLQTQNSDLYPRNLCPEKECGKAFRKQADLKRHVRKHPPSIDTVPWLQAHGMDLSNGFASRIRCTVPRCRSRKGDYHTFGRRDALVRHQKVEHKKLWDTVSHTDKIWAGEWLHINVDRFLK